MEGNSPVEILTGLTVITLIVGFVVYDSALTVRQVVALALQNPLITVPVGLLLFILLLFANPSRGADEA